MEKVTIRLKGPVKIDGDLLMPGDTPEVDPRIAAELDAAGLVDHGEGDTPAEGGPDAQAVVTMTADDLDRAVAERARIIAETIVEAAVERSVDFLTAERDAALARVRELETELAGLRISQNSPEQATGDAGATAGNPATDADPAPATDAPPAATAAKTTRKGAAVPKA